MLYGFGYRFINGQFVKGNVRNIEIEGWEYPDLNFGVANEALEIMANVSKKERMVYGCGYYNCDAFFI